MEESTDTSLKRDGGWGLVVLVACFFAHVIADGCAFSVGILYTAFLDYFNKDKSTTSWVGSLFVGLPLLAGPLASALTKKYGCRPVAMAGSIVSAFGAFISAFAPNLYFLFFSFGLSGLGLSMVYVPAVIMPAFYFVKYRALATGIAVSGSGIGTFAFAPLMNYLIDKYGWRGTMFIISGLLLNLCVCAVVYWPIREAKSTSDSDTTPINSNEIDKCVIKDRGDTGNCDIGQLTGTHNNININKTAVCDVKLKSHSRYKSCSSLSDTKDCTAYDDSLATTSSLGQLPIRGMHLTVRDGHPTCASVTSQQLFQSRKDLLFVRNVHSIGNFSMSSYQHLRKKNQHGGMNAPGKKMSKNLHFLTGIQQVLRETVDFSLLTNTVFLLFFLSNIILYMWYDIPYMYITDHATDIGYTEQEGSFLVSILGIVSTIGQVTYGFLGDRSQINLILLYAISTLLCGISVSVIPLFQSYIGLAFCCGAFGFTLSANYALETIVLVELMGLDELTTAYGIVLLGQGGANLIGPPIGGWLSDLTESYETSFITAGASIAISSFLIFAILQLRKHQNNQSIEEQSTASINDISLTNGKV